MTVLTDRKIGRVSKKSIITISRSYIEYRILYITLYLQIVYYFTDITTRDIWHTKVNSDQIRINKANSLLIKTWLNKKKLIFTRPYH